MAGGSGAFAQRAGERVAAAPSAGFKPVVGSVRIHARSSSATLQACATQPRGVKGASASKISLIEPMQAPLRCAPKPSSQRRALARSSGCARSHASTNGPMSHAHTVP